MPAALALLVDDSLLDSFLAVAAFKPDRGTLKLQLLYETPNHPYAERLAKVVHEAFPFVGDVRLHAILDDHDPEQIRSALAQTGPTTHLHHTGGTGASAALAMGAHLRLGRPLEATSSLDEDRRCLVLGSGEHIALHERFARHGTTEAITLSRLLRLAGIDERPARGHQLPNSFRGSDVRAIAHRVLVDPTPRSLVLVSRGGRPFAPDWTVLGPVLDPDGSRGLKSSDQDEQNRWLGFANGGWLELFTRRAVQAASAQTGVRTEILSNLHGAREQDDLELDLLVMYGHRPHLLSCCASQDRDELVAHLFEAELRADQLGGRVVRPALVTTARRGARPSLERVAAKVRKPVWSLGISRVFGREDLRAWYSGAFARVREPEKLASLREWFEEEFIPRALDEAPR